MSILTVYEKEPGGFSVLWNSKTGRVKVSDGEWLAPENDEVKNHIHIFGDLNQWAISEDDGCLRFHPQYNTSPEKISKWIWKEAIDEVEKLGGFTETIYRLRKGDCNSCPDGISK